MRPGSTLSSAAVRKITRAPGAAVRVISRPQRVELLVGHPVLRVEQHVAVDRLPAGFAASSSVKLAWWTRDAVGIGADRRDSSRLSR